LLAAEPTMISPVVVSTPGTETAATPFAIITITAQDVNNNTVTGFTGTVESQLEKRLGRPVDPVLSDLGRQLFFDKIMGLHSDNSCAGCHSPTAAFGDTQSIAIGVQNDNFVGPHRFGPRNQRRTPGLVNVAFYPKLMWNGRFAAVSGDPFDNSQGFLFPAPEGATRFPPNDPVIKHLLAAQGHIPPTELTEAAGFTGTRGTMSPDFDLFDDGLGSPLPAPDDTGTAYRFRAPPPGRADPAGSRPRRAQADRRP